MKIVKNCHINFSSCPSCDMQLTNFVDEIWAMLDFEEEIYFSTYNWSENDGVFTIKFDCGGICKCTCDYCDDIVTIIEWDC